MITLAHLLTFGFQDVLPDTVVMVADRDGYDLLVAIASGAIAFAIFGVLVVLAFSFVQLRRAGAMMDVVRKRFIADPGVAALRNAAANLEAISDTAAKESVKLQGAIAQLADRLTQASDRMEERIEDFNALMEVVQSEAEEVFVHTASTARGVKKGFSHLAGGGHDVADRAGGDSAPMIPPADFHPDDRLIE